MPQYEAVFNCINLIFSYYAEHTNILRTSSVDYLLKKNARDICCIAELIRTQDVIRTDFVQQIMVITRSFIESSILFIFLLKNESERFKYQEDSQLLLFKNAFMDYKYALTGKFDRLLTDINFSLDLLRQGVIETFHNLSTNNKKQILKVIKRDEFIIDDKTYSKLDSFLRNFKPISFSVQQMWRNLNNVIELNGKTLEDLTKLDYNRASQFTHNIYPLQKPDVKEAARICFSLTNITAAIINDIFKIALPEELRQFIKEAYIIIHPEDRDIII